MAHHLLAVQWRRMVQIQEGQEKQVASGYDDGLRRALHFSGCLNRQRHAPQPRLGRASIRSFHPRPECGTSVAKSVAHLISRLQPSALDWLFIVAILVESGFGANGRQSRRHIAISPLLRLPSSPLHRPSVRFLAPFRSISPVSAASLLCSLYFMISWPAFSLLCPLLCPPSFPSFPSFLCLPSPSP